MVVLASNMAYSLRDDKYTDYKPTVNGPKYLNLKVRVHPT